MLYKTILINPTYGPVVLLWSRSNGLPKTTQITRIIISSPLMSAEKSALRWFPEIEDANAPELNTICAQISSYLDGKEVDFSLALLKFSSCSEFQQSVLRANHAIPRGKVCSYSTLASHLNKPKASRAVGTALAANPFPVLIPCHRVIRSNRRLGGFAGGDKMKKALLENEGVTFDKTGKVEKSCISNQLK